MITFLGASRHSIDDKLRVAIPARFRDQVARSGQATLYTVARRKHIVVFPEETWGRFVERLLDSELVSQSPEDQMYLRRQVALDGEICRMDAQGRITLRKDQLETAGIERECIVHGNIRVIELWPEESFRAMNDEVRAQNKESLWLRVVRTL